MNLLKELIFYDYLYSPKHWLHKQQNVFKNLTIFIPLITLPYLSSWQLFLFIIFYLFVHEQINLSAKLTSYIYKIAFIVSLFTVLGIQNQQQILKQENYNRHYILIYNQIDFLEKKTIYNFYLFYGFPLSLIRLSQIYFLYLIMMKILVLTTHQRDILNCLFISFKRNMKWSIPKLIFEIQIALNFLNIILKQIEIMQVGYSKRSLFHETLLYNKDYLIVLFFDLQQLIKNIYNYIHNISNTLYHNEIRLNNLNIKY